MVVAACYKRMSVDSTAIEFELLRQSVSFVLWKSLFGGGEHHNADGTQWAQKGI
jgi:hypothetical protein